MNLLHKLGAILVQLIHGHTGRDRAQTIDQLTFDHLTQLFDVKCAITQGLSRAADAFIRRVDRDVEFHANIHTHPVFGDQCAIIAALHFQAQGLHVDRAHLMHQRDHKDTAVHDHFFPAGPCFHKADFARGALVETVQHHADENQSNQREAHDKNKELKFHFSSKCK